MGILEQVRRWANPGGRPAVLPGSRRVRRRLAALLRRAKRAAGVSRESSFVARLPRALPRGLSSLGSALSTQSSALLFEALESRLLLSAAPAALLDGPVVQADATVPSLEAGLADPTAGSAPALSVEDTPLEPLATTFLVTNTADAGPGSLRQAILDANAAAGLDTISFAIAGPGLHTIALASALDPISESVIIDGTTQAGYAGTPLIELSGAGAGSGVDGLRVKASNTTIRGLIINRFTGNGIRVENSTGVMIDGNYIGTDATGTTAQGNGNDGISLLNSSNNRIGGFVPGLVSLWSADGTVRDSVGSNNGALQGGATFGSGQFGQAFSFNNSQPGSTQSMQVPDAESLSPQTTANGELTISAWVSLNQLPFDIRAPIVAKGAPNNWEYALYINPDLTESGQSSLSFVVWQPGGADHAIATGGTIHADGKWHQVAGVFKKGQFAQLYEDGLFVAQDTSLVGAIANGTAKLFFGTRGDNQKFLTGSVDEVALFNKALTASEIQPLARLPLGDLGIGNRIAFNAGDGVAVISGTGNVIQTNSIFNNAKLGIDLGDNGVTANDSLDGDAGANRQQNFPLITAVSVVTTQVVVTGSLNSTPSTSFRLELYASSAADSSGFGEGQTFIGSTIVTTDSSGNATFGKTFKVPNLFGQALSIAATNQTTNDTSEFSSAIGAPMVDLDADDSSGQAGSNYTSVWTQGAGPVLIADRDATLSDPDSATLSSIAVSLVNRPNGVAEVLDATVSGTGITKNFDSAAGILLLTGSATVVQYQQVLRTITYNNTAASPSSVQRTVRVLANDGIRPSNTATAFLDLETIVTVTTVNDAGPGSLRQAILDVNDGMGKDQIRFNIPGAGVKTIALLSELPKLNFPVVIDGTTQPGYVPGIPVVVLDGAQAGENAAGLTISGGQSAILGLTLKRFGASAIRLENADSNVVDNSVIGTAAQGSGSHGISIVNSSNNLIGQQSPGLVSFWSGDGTAGDSLGLNNGTLSGTGTTFTTGRFGQAFNLDGITGFIQVPDDSSLSPHASAAGEMTLSAWVNLAQLPTIDPGTNQPRRAIVTKGGAAPGNNFEYGLYVYTDGTVGFNVWNAAGADYALARGGSLPTGGWHHVVGTLKKGERAVIYLDGVQVGEGPANTTRITQDLGSPLFIGQRGDGNQRLKALIDEVALFHRALSSAEIQAFASGARVGVGNAITANGGDGVSIVNGTGNRIQGNRISGNGQLGIDLGNDGVTPNDAGDGDNGANRLQNFPVLSTALVSGNQVTLTGSLNGLASTSYRIDLFTNPSVDGSGFGEGQTALGTVAVTTNASGNTTFSQTFLAAGLLGQFVSATATNLATNDTSELSQAILIGTGAPVVDLDGDDSSGVLGLNFSTDWTQSLGPVPIADLDSSVADPNSTNLSSMTIMLTNRPNGPSEILDATVTGTGITKSYNSSTGVLSLTGSAAVAQYQQVLRTVTYNNTASTPNTIQRVITVVASDGTSTSATATARLDIGRLFTVNSAGDQPDANPGDGNALTATGTTTLRAALQEANALPGKERIIFVIPGAGVKTILLTAALPIISDSVIIDATTQVGFALGSPQIVVDGSFAGNFSPHGFEIMAGDSVIRGFAISGFTGDGIRLDGPNGGSVLEANVIGIETPLVTRTVDAGGVHIVGSPGNRIGGTTAAERNVIAALNGSASIVIEGAGATGNVVQGNYLGTNVAGTASLGNTLVANLAGVRIQNAPNNVIGGTSAGAGNLISGNVEVGVLLDGTGTSGNLVQGNLIGTNAAGTGAIPNFEGIRITNNADSNLIGGTTAGARNVISGNVLAGVFISLGASGNQVQGNFIGTNAAGTAALRNGAGVELFGATGNVIGGTMTGARNLISGNDDGVKIDGTASVNLVQGNFIGTTLTGTGALPNSHSGVFITGFATYNVIGGTTPEARNIISGNPTGILLDGAPVVGNLIQGNFIGPNVNGTALSGSSRGVRIIDAKETRLGGTEAGAGNVIAFNGGAGVAISRTPNPPIDDLLRGTRNAVLGNSIFSNGGLGIDLEDNGVTANGSQAGSAGANFLQSFPVLTRQTLPSGSVTLEGTLSSTPAQNYLIEFFANPSADASGFGEGQRFVGRKAVTTDGSGQATFSATFDGQVSVGEWITATATHVEMERLEGTDPTPSDSFENRLVRLAGSSTSEFSAAIQVTNTEVPLFKLGVQSNGSRGGTIQRSIAGTGPDGDLYQPGTVVTLTANPNSDALFAGWSGFSVTVPTPTLTVAVTESRTYTATFVENSQESVRPALQYLEAVSFWPGTVTLTWLPVKVPSGLSLEQHRVYVGDRSGEYTTQPFTNVGRSQSSVTITNLSPIPHFFAVTLLFSGPGGSQESGFSNEVSATPVRGLEGFLAVDEGTVSGPSTWMPVQSPVTGQFSSIDTPDDPTRAQRGTLLFLTQGFPQGRTGYELTMTLASQVDGALGATFRFIDSNNYYRFSMDQQQAYFRLIKLKDGIASLLRDESTAETEISAAYATGRRYILTIRADSGNDALDSNIEVRLTDDAGVEQVHWFVRDPDFTGNGFGLYSAHNPGGFYDLVGAVYTDLDPNLVGLQVNAVGTGRGTIRSTVNGQTASLSSPGSPAATFARNTVVRLTATPTSGSRFGGWFLNGEFQTLDASITVTTTQSTFYEALFTPNAAPTGQNKTIPLTEDTSYTFAAADFGFSDADAGDTLSAVRIDALSLGGGALRLNGATVTTGQVILAADLSNLVFTPAPNANGNGIASFNFSVRDSALTFDPSPNTITFNVTAVNDAPVLDASKGPVLTAVDEDAVAPAGPVGMLVSALVDLAPPAGGLDNVTEVDSGALLGIAVTAVNTTNADWFVSTNNGTTWTALGTVSASNARLLAADANTRLYAQPKPLNFNGTLGNAMTFRAWDRTTGTNGGTADTTTNGGTTAFSIATDTAALTITAVNDAPVLNAIGQQTIIEEQRLTFTATAGDVDTPTSALRFSLDATAPAGAAIDAVTGAFAWTPTDAQGPETYQVRVIVSDGALSADQLVPITVRSSVTLDIDGDGLATATDGTLILRYLAGLPDRQLAAGLTAAGTSTPLDGAAMRRQLDLVMTREPLMLDADGDRQVNPFTDGRLIQRYLMDQTNGPSLTGVVVGANASRTTSEAIRTFLSRFLPVQPPLVPSGEDASLVTEPSVNSSLVTRHSSPEGSNSALSPQSSVLIGEQSAISPQPSALQPESSVIGAQLSVSDPEPRPSNREPVFASSLVPRAPSLSDSVVPMGYAASLSLSLNLNLAASPADDQPLLSPSPAWLGDFVVSSAVLTDDPNRDLAVAL